MTTLPPEARSAWLADAADYFNERAAERHLSRMARARDPHPIERPADITGLRRRRAAALRCEPLPGDGRRDPLEPLELEHLGWSELDRWAATLLHLSRAGLPGLPPADVARALARHPERYRDVLPQRPAA